MGYLDRLLAEDERVRLVAHRHVLFLLRQTMLYFLGAVVLWVLAAVVLTQLDTAAEWVSLALVSLSLLPLGVGLYRFLAWKSEQYVVTNYRIIQVEGISSKRTLDSALDKVDNVMMSQPMLGRIFGYGNIEIITGSENSVNHLTGIADPFAFKRGLLEAKMQLDGFGDERQTPSASTGQDPVRLLVALTELRDSGLISPEEYEERKTLLLQQR